MADDERFSCYTFDEGRTGIEQLVSFSFPVPPGGDEGRKQEAEHIKDFLKTRLRSIDLPETGQVIIGHGGYGGYTRYAVKQHKYAGGGHPGCGGFIEVLEISDPPGGRASNIIYDYRSPGGGTFTEWETLAAALEAFEKYGSAPERDGGFAQLPGFKRRVVCGQLTPWFYAIGKEELIGDYALPEGLQNDPVFRLGRKFVVMDDVLPVIKTCLGTRVIERKASDRWPDYEKRDQHYRLVSWDDGSVWDERNHPDRPPRPAEEGELWIAEAVWQFRQFLAGQNDRFVINFTDGQQFTGKLARPARRAASHEGDYNLAVQIEGEKEVRRGWITGFKPTPEAPNIIEFLTRKLEKKGKKILSVKIEEARIKKGGKKWAGVFFGPPV